MPTNQACRFAARTSELRCDTLWQLAERGTRAGIGFALSIVMARTLGPTDFGIYSYALASIALFAFLGQAGLDALLMREIVRAPQRPAPILSAGLYLRWGGAVCAAIGSMGVVVLFASTETRSAIPLVCILSLSGVLQAGWVMESLLLANRRFAAVAQAKISAYVFAAVLRLGALLLPSPLVGLAIATVLESLLCSMLLWRTSRHQFAIGWTSLGKPDFQHIAALAKLAAPMLLSAFTVAVYSRIDVFMLGRMLGSEAAGLYAAGTLLSEGFYLLPTAVMAAAGPRLAQLYMRDEPAFGRELHRFLRLLSVAGLGIALAVTFLAPLVLPWLFGPTYAQASPILQIHIWSTWAVFVSAASDPYYINHDLRRLYLLKTAVAAIVNIGLNLLLIPWLGPVGAAWATLVAYISSAVLIGALSPRTRPLFRIQLRALVGVPLPASHRTEYHGMKEHSAYSSSEAATYEADREVEPLWHVENAFVRALLGRSDVRSVLDAPVGTGRFLDLYEGKAVTGIDLSAAMLDEARKRVAGLELSNVALHQGSVTSLPFGNKQFDFVISWRLFHLLPPDTVAPALAELARVCQGTLCIQTYERAPFSVRWVAKAKRWARRLTLVFAGKRQLTPWSHIRAYTHSREAIEQAAHGAGLGAPTARTLLGDYEGTRVMALVWVLRR